MFGYTGQSAQPTLKFLSQLSTLLVVGLAGCAQMQQSGYYNPPPASTTTDAIAQGEGIYNNQTLRAPSQIQIDLRQPGLRPGASAPSVVANAAPANQSSPLKSPIAGSTASTNTAPQTKPYDGATAPTDTPPALTDAGSESNTAPASSTTDTPQALLIPEPQSFAGTLPCFHPTMKCSAQRITITLAPNGRWRARATYLEQTNKSGAVQTDQGCWRTSAQAVPRVVLLNHQGAVRAELAMTSTNILRLISMNGDNTNLTYNLSRQPDLDAIDELKGKPAPDCP